MTLILKNAGFDVGESLIVGGVPKPNAAHFSVNIGPNENNIALHVDVRFKRYECVEKLVLNAHQGGTWGEEMIVDKFPFQLGEKFKMEIKFSNAEFLVILPDNTVIKFPNCLGAEQYSHIAVVDDVRVTSIEIK